MPDPTLLAAIDLGSNSYRLEIGRRHGRRMRSVDCLRETVRQGGGLDEAGNLSAAAMERGWECLGRFADRLAGFAPQQVRAVATQTLREARNREVFLAEAQRVLGFPIEVISGQEEARLIYQGVAQLLPVSRERRLVLDIGGRSTELILGRGFEPRALESLAIGSVAWAMRFFADGRFTPQAFEAAGQAAREVMAPVVERYAAVHWDHAYGASGTVAAVAAVLAASGRGGGEITREALDWLYAQLLAAGSSERLRLPGLKEDRRPVIGGGLAVLRSVFELLSVQRLRPARGALRHGVLHELGRRR